MTRKDPPKAAIWILEHLVPGETNDALAGDLLEEFRSGRSSLWYWKQVLVAVVLGYTRMLRLNWAAILFSFLWTAPLPALEIYLIREMQRTRFFAQRWGYPWPYSTICDFGLTIGWHVLYLWIGIIVCFIAFAAATRSLVVGRVVKALWSSLLIYVAMFIVVLFTFLEFSRLHQAIDIWRVNPMSLIVNPGFIMSIDIPFFMAMMLGILLALPRCQPREAKAD